MWSLYVSTLLYAHRKDECDVKESVMEIVSEVTKIIVAVPVYYIGKEEH